MAKSPEATDPISYLSRLLRQPDAQTRQMIDDRHHVLREYGRLFQPSNLERLGAEDFKGFLLYDNNRHWTGISRQQGTLVSDMDRLRMVLGVLLDESRPLMSRLDWIEPRNGKKPQPGLGRAVMTPILQVAYPDKYGVWNSISEGAMTRLGLWPKFPPGSTLGGQYLLVNGSLTSIRGDLDTDLWTLDSLWWKVERDHEPLKHQFDGATSLSGQSTRSVGRNRVLTTRFTCAHCRLSKPDSLRSPMNPAVCIDCAD